MNYRKFYKMALELLDKLVACENCKLCVEHEARALFAKSHFPRLNRTEAEWNEEARKLGYANITEAVRSMSAAGKTLNEIAFTFGVSVSRVSRLLKKGETK